MRAYIRTCSGTSARVCRQEAATGSAHTLFCVAVLPLLLTLDSPPQKNAHACTDRCQGRTCRRAVAAKMYTRTQRPLITTQSFCNLGFHWKKCTYGEPSGYVGPVPTFSRKRRPMKKSVYGVPSKNLTFPHFSWVPVATFFALGPRKDFS